MSPSRASNPVGWDRVAVCCLAVGLAATGILARGAATGVATGSPDAQLVALFKSEGAKWIRSERERHRSRARPLSEEDRGRFGPYFPGEVLDRAKILVVEGFENPEFFTIFEERGEPAPIDMRRASAMALVDTILIARGASEGPARNRLLFHELVHLTQYRVLGLEAYMEGYVASWARNGRRYLAIPHEVQAFELASRFWRGGTPFPVESEVHALFEAARARERAESCCGPP